MPNATADFDVFIYQNNVIVNSNGASSADPEIAILPAKSDTYLVRIVPFAPVGQSYEAAIWLEDKPQQPGVGATDTPRFHNYAAPDGLGTDAAEPTLGVNWNTGKVMFIAGLQTLRVSFDDNVCQSPVPATWTDVSAFNTSINTLDPIIFTDPVTGRTIVSQLAGTSSLSSYTDDDGATWIPNEGGSFTSGVDHQTVGGGPFAAPLTGGTPLYPHAVYYCSQDLMTAFCALSADGGLTYGPSVPIFPGIECGGIHGHIQVGHDGTAYVPARSCNGKQSVSVSLDNGTTWTVRSVPDSTTGDWDPAAAVGSGGRLYFGWDNGDGHAYVATSDDKGSNWLNRQDVGRAFNIRNTSFPTMIAGDNDRAAFAFLGTDKEGTDNSARWDLYVATTYDGGHTWTTVNATPDHPVQLGTICTEGFGVGACAAGDRNLLDFMDIQLDKQGRILVGYADGCVAPNCTSPGSSRSKLATIARQTGGRTLFAAYDTPALTAPKAPGVQVTRDNSTVHMSWLAPDNGGAAIQSYRIYRAPIGGNEELLDDVKGGKSLTSYDDAATDPTKGYAYRITAVNSVGEGSACPFSIGTAPPPTPTPTPTPAATPDPRCGPGLEVATDPAADQTGAPNANQQTDIRAVSVAEQYPATGPQLVITLKLAQLNPTLLPPNTFWQVNFNATHADGSITTYFVNAATNSNANPAGIAYRYGFLDTAAANPTQLSVGAADAGSLNAADGTIRITLKLDKLKKPVPPATGQTNSTLTGPQVDLSAAGGSKPSTAKPACSSACSAQVLA